MLRGKLWPGWARHGSAALGSAGSTRSARLGRGRRPSDRQRGRRDAARSSARWHQCRPSPDRHKLASYVPHHASPRPACQPAASSDSTVETSRIGQAGLCRPKWRKEGHNTRRGFTGEHRAVTKKLPLIPEYLLPNDKNKYVSETGITCVITERFYLVGLLIPGKEGGVRNLACRTDLQLDLGLPE